MALTVCPFGWHLPSYDEWQTLSDFVGGDAMKLKSKDGWPIGSGGGPSGSWSYNYNGTDDYGFAAFPSCNSNGYSYWWTSTEDNNYGATTIEMSTSGSIYHSENHSKNSSEYLRCLND